MEWMQGPVIRWIRYSRGVEERRFGRERFAGFSSKRMEPYGYGIRMIGLRDRFFERTLQIFGGGLMRLEARMVVEKGDKVVKVERVVVPKTGIVETAEEKPLAAVIAEEVTEEVHRGMAEETAPVAVIVVVEDLTAVRVTRTAEKERVAVLASRKGKVEAEAVTAVARVEA
jgi:hypothetical protein